MLSDGSYDVFVLDAEPVAGSPEAGARTDLELTIVSGEHKGEVLSLTLQATLNRPATDLIGLPATLVVAGGHPALEF